MVSGNNTLESLGIEIPDVSDLVSNTDLEKKNYQTANDVEEKITQKGYQTQEQVETLISNKVSSVMTYKGTVDNYSDLANYTDTAKTGDTYNITNESEQNKAGDNATFNGSSWDVLSGTIDTSKFITDDDLEEISNAEIDEIIGSV